MVLYIIRLPARRRWLLGTDVCLTRASGVSHAASLSFKDPIGHPLDHVLGDPSFEFKPGEIQWTDAQSHIGENIGDTNTDVLIIELKEPRQPQTKRAASQ